MSMFFSPFAVCDLRLIRWNQIYHSLFVRTYDFDIWFFLRRKSGWFAALFKSHNKVFINIQYNYRNHISMHALKLFYAKIWFHRYWWLTGRGFSSDLINFHCSIVIFSNVRSYWKIKWIKWNSLEQQTKHKTCHDSNYFGVFFVCCMWLNLNISHKSMKFLFHQTFSTNQWRKMAEFQMRFSINMNIIR